MNQENVHLGNIYQASQQGMVFNIGAKSILTAVI
jgi:hypothetical protein